MKNDLKLKQSNSLILATHQMTIQQMRLFFYACSQYCGDLTIQASLDDVVKILTEDNGNRGGNQRDLIRENIPTIMRNAVVHLVDEDGEEWCSAIRRSRLSNDNTVTFVFDKSIQRELEELRGYTWMYLTQLTGMSSIYAVRLYEFFAMRLGANNIKGKFDFDINQLRLYLDCTKKYSKFKDFETNVLMRAKEQINEKSNITMTYKKVKTKQTITNIVFTFKWKNKDDAISVGAEPIKRSATYTDDEYDKLNERMQKILQK